MKIGILTFHRAHNYGAVLQAHALRTYLDSLGHDVEFIDYWPEYRKGMYDLVDFSFLKENIPLISKMKKTIRQILFFLPKYIRYQKFQTFIIEKLNVDKTSKISKGEEIPNTYDMYIFGSDQIWRNNNFKLFKGFDPVYWGKFPVDTRGKKITYAASMGELSYKGQERFITDHLTFFNSISAREFNLKDLIIQFTKKSVKQVLDPVFLLDQKKWDSLICSTYKQEKEYLLFYHLNYSQSAQQLAKKIAKSRNLKILEIKGGVSPFNNPFRIKQYIGPIEYLKLFRKADFVVSTSFHGVAFSIIFEKQFYALGMGNNSERVTNLLDKLDIKKRYLRNDEIKCFDKRIYEAEEINFINVEKNLDKLKKQSTDFLENAIHNLSYD